MNFSQSIRGFIDALNIRPSKLARDIGVTPQYMLDLLKGKRRWNEDILKKVCDALGLDIRITKKSA